MPQSDPQANSDIGSIDAMERQEACDASTPPDRLDTLAKRFPHEVAANPNANLHTLFRIAHHHHHLLADVTRNSAFRLALRATPHKFKEMSSSFLLLTHAAWPPDALEDLGSYLLTADNPDYIARLLLENPNTPPDLLDRIRDALDRLPEEERSVHPADVDQHVNSGMPLAADPLLTLNETLQGLISEFDPRTLAQSTRVNPPTQDFQTFLLEHAPTDLAVGTNLSDETWQALARHSREVREALLGNPLTPEWVLIEAFESEERDLKERLTETQARSIDPPKAFEHVDPHEVFELEGVPHADDAVFDDPVSYTFLTHPQTGARFLSVMAQSEYVTPYAHEIARHPRADSETFNHLDLEEPQVRWQLALHPNTPPDILAKLANDIEDAIKSLALNHPNCPEQYPDPLFSYGLDSFSQDMLQAHGSKPANVTVSTRPLVRLAAALNPNTTPEDLRALANDGDQRVRAAAQQRLADRGDTSI